MNTTIMEHNKPIVKIKKVHIHKELTPIKDLR